MKNFPDLIKKAIIDNGGLETDTEFLIDELASEFGKKLAQKGIQSRTKNPAYNVKPVNTVDGIKKYFDWMYDWITPKHCLLKPVADESKIIELIKCKPGSTEATLKEIAERGFDPAPSNYVLGLGVQHPDAHREHKYVVSLDKENLFDDKDGRPCFLCLYWYGKSSLDMARESGGWHGHWWFAVVRKSTSNS